MLIYLGVFGVSIALTFYGEYLRKKENRAGWVVCIVLAVLLVSVLAGARDLSVGTDSLAYSWWVDDAGYCSTVTQAMRMERGTEPFCMILAYLAVKFLGGVYAFFFLSGLLTYGFAMAALVCLRDHIALPYGWAAYLFLFYGNSLNQLRQALAMTVVLFAITLLMQKKYLASVVLLAFSVSIHNSAALGVGILLLYLVLKKWNTVPVKGVLVGGMVAAAVFYRQLFELMGKLVPAIQRFTGYLDFGNVHFSLNPILIRLPFLLLALWLYREFSAEDEAGKDSFTKLDADFLLIMMAAELVTAEMRVISVNIYRISLYFGVFRCVLIGRTAKVLEQKQGHRVFYRLVLAGILALLVVIWLYQAVLKGNDEIIPYTSQLLHIGAAA